MTRTRIRSLTVKGFRAYGAAEQTLNVPAELAAVWGPNSKGKTSLAEAFEFLLTGKVVRRELMASAQDEFADALRNAHLATADEVFVAAKIEAPDDAFHEIKRILTADYGKRQDCALDPEARDSQGAFPEVRQSHRTPGRVGACPVSAHPGDDPARELRFRDLL